MPIIDLPQGQMRYRLAGPSTSTAPPVVFVHGLLTSSELWTGVADNLAARGVRMPRICRWDRTPLRCGRMPTYTLVRSRA